jgi:BirA family transcriptional regulator, biotin operon repressor / biotin---[acetyl-CoA-carboxylase] ligase
MANKTAPSNLLNSYHLLSFDELDSTNEEAKRLARGGGCHGAVIWAKKQTDGKGRLGRNWVSSEGNLFVSILLQPEKPMKDFSQLSFVAAVAAIEAMQPLLPPGKALQCKWPNDIILDNRKAGGILLESFQINGESWVVVGIGVNIESCPPRAEFPATCLKEAGVELVSAKIVLSRFIHHFIESYNQWNLKGFLPTRKAWMQYAWGVGTRVVARWPDGEATGIAEGIDRDGSLILSPSPGKRQLVHAADIFPAEVTVKKAKK